MTKIEKLQEFVKEQHKGQMRKYTDEPYYNHVLQVSQIVKSISIPLAEEVGLCHDLFEDTNCCGFDLFQHLLSFGYTITEIETIRDCVDELTDVFTKKAYPYLNRELRKKCECARLSTISDLSQTVKYADIMSNAASICEHDNGFATVYLNEVMDNLNVMTKGNEQLAKQALSVVTTQISKIL